MGRLKIASLVMVATTTFGMAASALAGDAVKGKTKSALCANCHGNNGIASISIYPNLAGQNEPYLVAALKAYKANQRTGGQAGIMRGYAAMLSDADMANLAAYYSSLK